MGTYTINCLKQFLCKSKEPLVLTCQVVGTQVEQGRKPLLDSGASDYKAVVPAGPARGPHRKRVPHGQVELPEEFLLQSLQLP